MSTAYFIYTITPLFLFLLSYISIFSNQKSRYFLWAMIIVTFSIIFGLRYDVGVDYLGYLDYYSSGNSSRDSVEWGYAALNSFFFSFGAHYSILFISLALLQISPVVLGFKDNKRALPILLLLYFYTAYLFFSLNGIRQSIAFSFIFFSLQYIDRKSFIKYVVCITIAMSFHKSAALFYPLYFILRKEYFSNRSFQVLLLLASFLLGDLIQTYLWLAVPLFSSFVLGDSLSDIQLSLLENTNWNETGAGLAKYFWLLINLSVISYYPMIRSIFKNKRYDIYYNLYFVGALLENIIGSSYLQRVNVYFVNYRMVIFSFFIFTLVKSMRRSNYLMNMFLITIIFGGLLLFYYLAISKKAGLCAPFQFVLF